MLTLLGIILLFMGCGKLFVCAVRLAWGLSRMVFSIFLVPLVLIGLLCAGAVYLVIGALAVCGLVGLVIGAAGLVSRKW